MYKINLSVRKLVEYVYRSGDLDNTYMSNIRAMEGIDIHKKLQEKEEDGYNKEYYLKYQLEYNDILLAIEGRADGIYTDENIVYIDEIKSTYKNIGEIDDENITHWAQAYMYGYMYCKLNNIEQIGIRLRYCNVENYQTKEFKRIFLLNDLQLIIFEIIERYSNWAKLTVRWQDIRKKSIKSMEFPFDKYRKGQREMAVAVFQTIKEGKNIFIQAPTGIGKTISTIFPTIKYLGNKKLDKIYYLTAKSSTKEIALENIKQLCMKGLKIKTVVITAKEKICFKEECICDKENCQYANKYFDKINNVLYESFKNYDIFSREIIENIARKYEVCPFELTLDLSLISDFTICDYNYFYDPRVSLKREFSEENNETVVLIDEAHNLTDRAREMYSAELLKSEFLDLSRPLKGNFDKEYKAIRNVNAALLELANKNGDNQNIVIDEPEKVLMNLKKMNTILDKWLSKNKKNENYKNILDLFFKSLSFLRISELYNEDFCYYTDMKGDFKIKIYCMDPSNILKSINKKIKSAVFFSATLIPLRYYKNILGGVDEDNIIKFESPFDKEKFDLIINSEISMKYVDRDKNIDSICLLIYNFINIRKGNYLIFFPSYKFMKDVYETYCQYYNVNSIYVQRQNMTEGEQNEFLNLFNLKNEITAFVVLGGTFSEGIDLIEDKLIGAVILGAGVPQINFQRDLIMKRYNNKYKTGYEFAYMFPGFSKVLQASGRVIRTENDKGTVLLVDNRFLEERYKILFPDSWDYYIEIKNSLELEIELTKFWEEI